MIKGYTHSVIGGYVGPAGGGKSASMADAILRKLLAGEKVWSNMPVKTSDAILNRHTYCGKKIVPRETEPLDWGLLYMLDESMVNGVVAIDEIGYYASSRQSMDTRNRLINACCRQVRHRCLDMIFTAKSFDRVDYYLRDETDFLVECFDLALSPWGRKNGVPFGTAIRQRYYDISGKMTGYPVSYFSKKRAPKPYKCLILHGQHDWDCYDTREIISLEEAFSGVKLDFQKRVITNRNNDATQQKVIQALADMKFSGKDVVPSDAFYAYLGHKMGVEMDPAQIGRFIPKDIKRKWSRRGSILDLTDWNYTNVVGGGE